MYKRALVIGFFLIFPISSEADCMNFSRTLKVGMNGADVKQLQIILNGDDSTRVSSNGVGSPGHESNYFGNATARALAKYQEKYANVILTPSGLTKGSGLLGLKTRAALNRSCQNTNAAATDGGLLVPVTSDNIDASTSIEGGDDSDIIQFKSADDLLAKAKAFSEKNHLDDEGNPMAKTFNEGMAKVNAENRAALKPQNGIGNHLSSVPINITALLPDSAWPGMIVRIIGFGFSGKDKVTIGGRDMEVFAPSDNGILLPFAIPNDMAPGKYTVNVDTGTSKGQTVIEILSNK